MSTLYKESKKTEEVQDIIDRMPVRFGRWVASAVIAFTLLVIGAGFVIKYPDVVTGQIRINSTQSPVKLVANVSGKLQLCCPKAQNEVTQNEYVAVLQNAANTEDMRQVIGLTRRFDLNAGCYSAFKDFFPEKVSLGELNLKYYSFLNALKAICHYETENTFRQKRTYFQEFLRLQHILLKQTQEEIKGSKEKLDMAEKWLRRNAGLHAKDMIPEFEMDQVKTQFLNAQSTWQSLQKTETSIQLQITEAENQLKLLEVEREESENALHLNLFSSFQDLTDNLKTWEEKYVFKAPFDGKVEFLKFWKDGQFVQAGEEIFSIVPRNTDILGQMWLPAKGAGKVKQGNEVIIKLDNYPYIEFGSIEGKVSSISLVTNVTRTGQETIETYLVNVVLPEDLMTNYGKTLEFQYELNGSADIVVNKRRLIERLFDNLKYTTK